jgi:polar amino acid transport system substrate-binding protein
MKETVSMDGQGFKQQAFPAHDMAAARRELAGSGALRVGVVYAPQPSPFFVVRDADHNLTGVTVDLGRELAAVLDVPVSLTGVAGSGELVDALEDGRLDVAFMPVDDVRRQRIDFGPDYYVVDSTCLVRAGSQVDTIDAMNEPHVRVAGIAETTTIRAAQRALPHARFTPVSSVDDALRLLRDETVDAIALSRDVLDNYQPQFPGSQILKGAFHTVRIAIAVGKSKPAALSFVTLFMEQAKRTGLVQRAFERAGV